MLDTLHIKNLRSIEDILFKFKKLTILTGLNSSGKSTVVGSITMLKQVEGDQINLNGDYVNFGTIKSTCGSEGEKASIEYNFSEHTENIEISKENSLLRLNEGVSVYNSLSENVNKINIRYLSSDRISPEWVYRVDTKSYRTRDLGPKGEYTISFLCQVYESNIETSSPYKLFIPELAHKNTDTEAKDQLIPNINEWLSVISPGVSIDVEHLKQINQSQLSFNTPGNNSLSPYSVGFGLTHCLPIIVNILTSKVGDILIIENPELNLHPEGQIQIGKLISKAAALGVQIIIETHSDHIVNAARISLKDRVISTNDLEIKYLEIKQVDTLGFTTFNTHEFSVLVDEDGKLREPPAGFFDTWKKSLMELL